jgi:hypothetical protein
MKRALAAVIAAIALLTAGNAAEGMFAAEKTPSQTARSLLTQWTAYVTKGAKLNPTPRFARANRAIIARTVARNASRFRYVPRHAAVLRGRDGAPLVIVQVSRRHLADFSESFAALWRRLDPLTRPGPDRLAYRYEAFFSEAVDSQGIPFLVVWNAWRRPPRGGGQWARTEALLPFPHG